MQDDSRTAAKPPQEVPEKVRALVAKVAKLTGQPPEAVSRLLTQCNAIIAEKAKDNEKFVAGFIIGWQVVAENLANFTSAFKSCTSQTRVGFTDAHVRCLLKVYSIEYHYVYASLADHLTYQQEYAFESAAHALMDAWRRFFAAVLAHTSVPIETITRTLGALETVHEQVVKIYTGEIPAELTSAWQKAFEQLRAGLQAIGGMEVAS